VSQVTGYVNPSNPSQTIGDAIGSSRATVLFNASGGVSNTVVLGAAYFSATTLGQTLAASQNVTLIHEALHTGTGLNDEALAGRLGFGEGLPHIAASNSISIWLATDCPPVP
jgi:hypothetical protein